MDLNINESSHTECSVIELAQNHSVYIKARIHGHFRESGAGSRKPETGVFAVNASIRACGRVGKESASSQKNSELDYTSKAISCLKDLNLPKLRGMVPHER